MQKKFKKIWIIKKILAYKLIKILLFTKKEKNYLILKEKIKYMIFLSMNLNKMIFNNSKIVFLVLDELWIIFIYASITFLSKFFKFKLIFFCLNYV